MQLHKRLGAEMQRGGGRLPSKIRLPSTLEVEGAERLPALNAYLKNLVASGELRRSEQLVYFLAANTPSRRRLWRAAVFGDV